jgi:26S proteasome regulatory subunit N8
MVRNFSVKSNDYMYVIYVSTLIRSILSLHDLINNKINLKETELANEKKAKEAEEERRNKKEEDAKKKVEEALKKAEGAPGAEESKGADKSS